ncbi:hypothetical protein EDB89DRAFT_2075158 [Lactarius sanguifluus]|nr:hypothetical protein EDB89DRAFT_2075158 [Lactarius sanguifluus]
MTNLNLLRRFLIISIFLSTGTGSATPPSCAISCTSSTASQIGCDIYKVACFCNNTQFLNAARSCIQETCAASGIQDATDFINDLCTVSSTAVSTASSNRPSATSGASQNTNAAAVTLKRDMALMGGLSALQIVAAIISSCIPVYPSIL